MKFLYIALFLAQVAAMQSASDKVIRVQLTKDPNGVENIMRMAEAVADDQQMLQAQQTVSQIRMMSRFGVKDTSKEQQHGMPLTDFM
jgi:hypothetical protein